MADRIYIRKFVLKQDRISIQHACWKYLSFALLLLLQMFFSVAVLGQIEIGTINRPGLVPAGLAVYEFENKLCVFDDQTNSLLIYDGATLTLEKELTFRSSISDPFSFHGMVVDEADAILYICVSLDGVRIVCVNLYDYSFINEIYLPNILPQTANGIQYDAEIKKIFVAEWPDAVFIVDLSTNEVSKINLPSDGAHIDMTINPMTHELFLANLHTPKLRIINGITHQLSEVDAVKAFAMTVNWLENKIYIIQALPYLTWIYDRDDGSIKLFDSDNDSESLIFNPGSNIVYSSTEWLCISTLIDGYSDDYFRLPMEGGTATMGFRFSTKHAYFVGSDFMGVYDESSQMFEKIYFDNPYYSGGDYQLITVNQMTGYIYVTNVRAYESPNPILVFQDTEMMIRPNVLLGGYYIVTNLDPLSYKIVDLWGQDNVETIYGISYNPSGSRAYVTGFQYIQSQPVHPGRLSVHAGSGAWDENGIQAGNFNARIGSFDMTGHDPVAVVPSLDGTKLYVTCSASDLVKTFNVANDSDITVLYDIEVGNKPWGAALTPEGTQLYITNKGSNNVSVIDLASSTVTQSISVGEAPWGIAINPSSTLVYVANSESGTVSAFDISANTIITTIPAGSAPHWISFTPDGKYAYVTNNASSTLSVIDAGNHQVIQTVQVGKRPEGICFYPDGSRAYVANENGASIINTSTYSVTSYTDEYYGPYHSVAIANPFSRFAGRVTNQKGFPVGNAIVRATQDGVEKGVATTNVSGDYCIFYLSNGIYNLELSGADFPTQYLMEQQVNTGQTKIVHFSAPTRVEISSKVPLQFSLQQNYPNPFNSETTIGYELPLTRNIELSIYNVLGEKVAELANGKQMAGAYEIKWNAKGMASGIYVYQLRSGEFVETKKLILLQ